MTFEQWQRRWHFHVPTEAVRELQLILAHPQGGDREHSTLHDAKSEAYTMSDVLLTASRVGIVLYRNNVGVLEDINGRPVRYGLANESAKMNAVIKSGDFIGATPHVCTAADIGRTLGVFTSVECKRPDWTYKGNDREVAQFTWQKAVESLGGVALFATSGQDLIDRCVTGSLLSPEQLQGLYR